VPNNNGPCAATIRDTAAVMTVVVRDPAAEHDGGHPYLRMVTISAFCPTCAQRRGQPHLILLSNGRRPYWVDVWHNDCGHADNWESVLEEAAQQCARPDCVLLQSVEDYPYCSDGCAVHTVELLDWWRVLRSYLHRTSPALVHVAEAV
jgi:hypothetical protein